LQRLTEPAPTIATVARLANVSVASASRALNGIKTTPAVFERVVEAAERIGYVPNEAARSLRSRRTGQIGFAMPDVANPVYTTMVESIQEVARARGWRLTLHSTGADIDEELAIVRDLKRRFVDGLILVSLRMTERHAGELENAGAPVVVIGPANRTNVDTVRANSRRGAAEAVRHLRASGRRRIAFVNGPRGTVPATSRRLGYLDGLRSAGIRRDDSLIEDADDFTMEPGRQAAERLLTRVTPDAIFCANDLLAIGALAGLRGAGLSVPDDVAVVGMDNTYLCELTMPPLTTIDLGAAERARTAAELLVQRLEHPDWEPRAVDVAPRLVIRATCGASA
jgi:LacI family transcriptional regulator